MQGSRLSRLLPLLLLLGAVSPAVHGAEEAGSAGLRSLKGWIDGPVRYIVTKEEERLFRSLENDRERAAFIEAFWQRRDPTPETLVNEYRLVFWQRVQEANRLFQDTPRPGWRTDRGRIYILYGPPTRIEDEPFAETRASPGAGRGLIRWFYEGRPGGRTDLNPVVVVPFVRDLTGEYRLSYEPKLYSEFHTWRDIKDRRDLGLDRYLGRVDLGQRSLLSVMADMGRLQEIPSTEEVLLERVETFQASVSGTLPVAFHRYQSGPSGSLVSITAELPGDLGAGALALVARLAPRSAPESPRLLGEGSFLHRTFGRLHLAQARVHLAPGTYDVTILAFAPDLVDGRAFRGVVEVPPVEDAGRLRLSDLTLARHVEPVPYDSLASYREPFVVGRFQVVPRVQPQVLRGENAALFFEIYGGAPPYRVTFQLEGLEADGRWTPLGRPTIQEGAEGAHAWALQTNERWPLGRYRFRVEVRDAAGGSHEGSLEFELTATTLPVAGGR